MSTEASKSQTSNPAQKQQDINEIFKTNFEKYFQEVEKVMPEYLQSFTTFQEEFLTAWKNTINSSIDLQKEFAEKNNIDTNIPQYAADIIQNTAEEYIKSKNIQNQTILAAIDTANNNFKNYKNSFEPFTQASKQFLDFWLGFYLKNNQ